jgi:hypothetical protein
MCDGQREEITWTIRHRATGEPLVTAEGYTFSFAEEAAAQAFLAQRPDAAAYAAAPVAASESLN